MTEEELENAAIQSALNMGPAEHMFHPDYGWVLRDGKVTEVGEEFFRKAYEGKLVCPNPTQEVIVNCCMCDGFLVNGTCVQEFCLANPSHKKWEVPKKTSILTKVKVFILGLFLTGCSSMPLDSFNNPVWDCYSIPEQTKMVKIYAPNEYYAIDQARLIVEKYPNSYTNIMCVKE